MEALLEELLFTAPDRSEREVKITRQYVRDTLQPVSGRQDAAGYIL
jgi:ATP-dependent protease HslVU (ClpYQ) ATPase subunit